MAGRKKGTKNGGKSANKTVKAVAKRIKKRKSGDHETRAAGQDHFNARESGKTMRNKRTDNKIDKTNKRNIDRALQ